jgi:ferritin-like metal-binding protein YciE
MSSAKRINVQASCDAESNVINQNPNMPSEITSIHEVFVDQLKDLYSAETQIVKALPKMAKAAASVDLKNGFTLHLQQTKEHVARLKSICAELHEKPTGKTCQATVGLVKEGEEAIEEDALPEMKDLMLIAAARRVEHYEISGYTSACDLAKALGLSSAFKTLSATLTEESATDAKLAKASGPAVVKAKAAGEPESPADPLDGAKKAGKAIKKIVKKIAG